MPVQRKISLLGSHRLLCFGIGIKKSRNFTRKYDKLFYSMLNLCKSGTKVMMLQGHDGIAHWQSLVGVATTVGR